MKTGIEILGISAAYEDPKARPRGGATQIFSGLSMRVGRGQVAVVVGPSGAGKSTLLNCVAGLHPVQAGTVVLASDSARGAIQHGSGAPPSAEDRRRIGVAFQQSNLWSHLSVRDNLVHPQMKLVRRTRAQATQRADELLADLALAEHATKPATALSGGQRQRVAIARALCLEPDVVLFDEITANQDPENTQRVLGLIRRFVAGTGATALTVSHDMAFVRRIADVVLFLAGGVVRWQAPPDEFFNRPQDEDVVRFLQAL